MIYAFLRALSGAFNLVLLVSASSAMADEAFPPEATTTRKTSVFENEPEPQIRMNEARARLMEKVWAVRGTAREPACAWTAPGAPACAGLALANRPIDSRSPVPACEVARSKPGVLGGTVAEDDGDKGLWIRREPLPR